MPAAKSPSGRNSGGGAEQRRAASSMKWDNTARKASTIGSASGRKPLPEPMTVANSILMVILHVCRKAVLIDPKYKVGLYFFFIFVGSTLTDIGLPIPRTYFANKNNFLNQYFVKWGWAWTLSLTSAYIYLTTRVYCAGDRQLVINHMLRMLVCTAVWFGCTNLFVYVESRTGACSVAKIASRTTCIRKGHRWVGFDISGHSFILIFCHLLIAEELRSLLNWERLADILRNEQFDEDSPIKELSEPQKVAFRENYPRYTPYIRALFIALTLLALLWDMMLVGTVLYFHSMVQKMGGAVFAVVSWYILYKFWFPSQVLPPAPGVGLIRYTEGYRRG